ncbi:MAG: rRNA maturation RNase YbeY [Bacteroidales bacterium]|nr:rRNA maturation RNase YbeY [Bacteroidales bacterium]
MVKFFNKNTSYKLPAERLVKQWIGRTLQHYGCKEGRLYVIFMDDPSLLQMNRDFIGHDYYTDIITFDTSDYPESPKDAISGELYISVDTVQANAEEYGATFLEEMYRVIIHGVLHLVGFDDHEETDICAMRQAESEALERLKENGVEF